MTAGTHADMHAEHRLWRGDFSLWREEMGVWQAELNRVGADLERLAPALPSQHLMRLRVVLRTHREVFDAHRAAIDTHDRHVENHEAALARFEKGGPANNDLLNLAKDHQREIPRHAKQREAHERLKKCQRTLMARWPLLLKALAEPA
jgi:hypothetical protein